jgi:integrase
MAACIRLHVGLARLASSVWPLPETKAREWLELIEAGKDPREIARANKAAQANQRDLTFALVLETYLAQHVSGQRRADDVAQVMRRELLPRGKTKLVTEITRNDVVRLIDTVKERGAIRQAHNVFGYVRAFFNWTIERGSVQKSPCELIRPERLIGAKVPRKRVLTDAELRAFWAATNQLAYPSGPLFQILLLTGQRKSEVAEASWSEFNLAERIWTIPPERFKSDAVHIVPLTDDVIALLHALPRWRGGDYLFSTTGGTKPVNGFGRAKEKLDTAMLATPHIDQLPAFVLHDLRRTVRTRLSSLRVPTEVSELVIGHGPQGLRRVYDQHEFQDEMREALTAWNAKLRAIISPPSANVVPLLCAAS